MLLWAQVKPTASWRCSDLGWRWRGTCKNKVWKTETMYWLRWLCCLCQIPLIRIWLQTDHPPVTVSRSKDKVWMEVWVWMTSGEPAVVQYKLYSLQRYISQESTSLLILIWRWLKRGRQKETKQTLISDGWRIICMKPTTVWSKFMHLRPSDPQRRWIHPSQNAPP